MNSQELRQVKITDIRQCFLTTIMYKIHFHIFHSEGSVNFRLMVIIFFHLKRGKEYHTYLVFSVVRDNINKACDITEGDTGQKDYCQTSHKPR